MKKTGELFAIGLRQILRDGMLFVLLPAPFLVGLFFKVGMPLANDLLTRQYGFSLLPWYGLADALLLCLAPMFVAMVAAFLLLEERDEGLFDFYCVTPANGRPYWLARLGIPMLWGFVSTLVAGLLFRLSGLPGAAVLAGTAISVLAGILLAMGLASLAKNRVEGLALSKMAGLGLAGLVAAWFVPAPYAWLLGFMPSYWVGLIAKEGASAPAVLAGIGVGLLWLLFAKSKLARAGRLG